MLDELNVVIVGIGGVGGHLAPLISRYCQHLKPSIPVTITLVDGDGYEEHNAARQAFQRFGNKAEVTVESLVDQFDRVTFTAVGEFLTPDNIDFLLGENVIVFCCVDNNRSRKVIDDYVGTLQNAVLVSGGNDMTDGNVQVYIRRAGKDVTRSISSVHDETANPVGKAPYEMSCEEMGAASSAQLFFANAIVSTLMCLTFYNLVEIEGALDKPPFGELYFDMLVGRVEAVERKPSIYKETSKEEEVTK